MSDISALPLGRRSKEEGKSSLCIDRLWLVVGRHQTLSSSSFYLSFFLADPSACRPTNSTGNGSGHIPHGKMHSKQAGNENTGYHAQCTDHSVRHYQRHTLHQSILTCSVKGAFVPRLASLRIR